ncbi:hypothetical protein LXL04_015857 [Taraxacum kok-saghyz]
MLMARFQYSTLAQPPIPFQIAIDSYKSIHIKSDRFTLLELQLHRRRLPSLFLIFSIFSLPLNPWNGGNKIGLRKMDTELCGKGESRLPPDFDIVDERLQREGESVGSDWTTPSPSSRSHPPSPPSEKNQNGGNLVFLQNSKEVKMERDFMGLNSKQEATEAAMKKEDTNWQNGRDIWWQIFDRWSAFMEDGKVKVLNVENVPSESKVSGGENIQGLKTRERPTIFPFLQINGGSSDYIISRAILSTKNENVDEINDQLIDRFIGEQRVYYSFDEAEDDKNNFYPMEFLNSLNVSGLPPHYVRL